MGSGLTRLLSSTRWRLLYQKNLVLYNLPELLTLCVSVCVCVCERLYGWVCEHVCGCERVCGCVSICTGVCVSVCVCEHLYGCVCERVCVCV